MIEKDTQENRGSNYQIMVGHQILFITPECPFYSCHNICHLCFSGIKTLKPLCQLKVKGSALQTVHNYTRCFLIDCSPPYLQAMI